MAASARRNRSRTCPEDEVLAAFIDGDLTAAGREHVHVHLDVCPTCRQLVAMIGRDRAPHLTTAASQQSQSDRKPPPPGTRVGRFVVRRLIGRGGMGVVLEAEDPQLDRPVAIKLMTPPPRGDDGPTRARQLREARALAHVTHPHVVEIYDVGLHDDRVFMAMELVAGRTLRLWVDECDPSWREIVAALIDAGKGLAAVHAAGLVHRDFKPDNVLVGDDGRVRVADFGLVCVDATYRTAEAVQATPTVEHTPLATPLTAAGEVLGTPAYMAPEQHRGRPVGPHSDQFAYCVTAYELLYGRRPFAGSNVHQLLGAIERGAIRRPRWSSVPRSIHAAVTRGLRRDPTRRWTDMDALLGALRRPLRRPTKAVVAIAFGLTATAAATALATHRAPVCDDPGEATARAWRDRAAAVSAAFARAQRTEQLGPVRAALDDYASRWEARSTMACEAIPDETARSFALRCLEDRRYALAALVDVLVEADGPAIDRALSAASSLPDIEPCMRTAADHVAGGSEVPAVEPGAREKLARAIALLRTGDHRKAMMIADTLVTEAPANDPVVVTRAQRIRGIALRSAGRMKEAEAVLTDAFFRARDAEDEQSALQLGLELATLVGDDLGRVDEGMRWIGHAVKASPQALQARPRFAALAEDSRGIVLRRGGHHEKAIDRLRRAVEIADESDDVEPLNRAYYHSHLGATLAMMGRNSEARPELERALALAEAHAGPWHPQVGLERLNVGSAQLHDGELEHAKTSFVMALQVLERTYAADHPLIATAHANLGLVHRGLGSGEASLVHLRRALEGFTATFGREDPNVAKVLGHIAHSHLFRNEFEQTIRASREAIAILEVTGGDDDALGRAHMHLATALGWVGDVEQAPASFETALGILEKHFGPGHGIVGLVHGRLCHALLDAGRLRRAESHCRRAVLVARSAQGSTAAFERDQRAARARLDLRRGRITRALENLPRPSADPDGEDGEPFDVMARSKIASDLADAGQHDLARAYARWAADGFAALGPAFDTQQQAARALAR